MAEIELKHLKKVVARGHTYYYAWTGGPRIKARYGTPEFVAEYQEHHGQRKRPDHKLLNGVVAAYKASDAWKDNVSDKTKASWSLWLDRIQERFGDVRLAAFDLPQIKGPIKAWRGQYKATPRAADMGIQVLSVVLSFAIGEGWLGTNACSGLEPLYQGDRSDIIWEDAELASVEEHACAEQWRVVRLAVLTGLRKGDLLKLSWGHIKKTHIQMRTGKSGEKRFALVPMYDELEQFLATLPRSKKATTVLFNTYGLPWGSGWNSSWRRLKVRAKVEKHFHDLRGNAATVMYRSGLDEEAIAETLGWSVENVRNIIKKYVNLEKHMAERIARINAARAARQAATGTPGEQ